MHSVCPCDQARFFSPLFSVCHSSFQVGIPQNPNCIGATAKAVGTESIFEAESIIHQFYSRLLLRLHMSRRYLICFPDDDKASSRGLANGADARPLTCLQLNSKPVFCRARSRFFTVAHVDGDDRSQTSIVPLIGRKNERPDTRQIKRLSEISSRARKNHSSYWKSLLIYFIDVGLNCR